MNPALGESRRISANGSARARTHECEGADLEAQCPVGKILEEAVPTIDASTESPKHEQRHQAEQVDSRPDDVPVHDQAAVSALILQALA